MLKDIRESLMDKLHKKKDMIKERDLTLCPRIQQQLEKHKIWAKGWNAFWDGGLCYGVRDGATQTKYVVNLVDRTCSYNAWQVSGIPCKHTVVAIWNNWTNQRYVNDYFRKHTYAKAYDHLLEPLNGPQEWPTAEYSVIAPELKKVHNKPKTKRRPSAGEVTDNGKLRKIGFKITCSLCWVPGHNKTTCKNALRESPSGPNTTTATPNDPTPAVPMHNRGVGVYTYPNGYQR
ncbi:uncharacterized protein LOC110684825 [Chenopodium quinoa]|uniref:uncharacterized protein LOC110684825 n=1 Tax=Chenopodium quinoa TaxID=63459 RepID=UPI000B7950EA|nr:uncharacterized protein LOC110684825 [Chenopodium quinoa]XP_021716949.1 uncharacterized protein LOC110684825 [Chenopodium quinoa]